MSKSIVKQSLQLFAASEEPVDTKRSKKEKIRKNNLGRTSNFTTQLSSEKRYSGKTIDQIRKQYSKQKDRTEENLRKLTALGRNRVSEESSSAIFKRASRWREEPEIVKPTEGTVFTEEDFVMFQREYVVD